MGASPGAAVALTKMNAEIDVRNVLPTVRVPTLVIHRSGDMCLKVEEGRFVASQIPACKYVELGGIDHLPFVGKQDEILDEIEEFLTGMRQSEEYDRVLATVMSVKIVDPKAQAARNRRIGTDLLRTLAAFMCAVKSSFSKDAKFRLTKMVCSPLLTDRRAQSAAPSRSTIRRGVWHIASKPACTPANAKFAATITAAWPSSLPKKSPTKPRSARFSLRER